MLESGGVARSDFVLFNPAGATRQIVGVPGKERYERVMGTSVEIKVLAMNAASANGASAAVLAFAVAVHLATIIYAVRAGLTAGEILGRTRENNWFLAFYLVFVLAVAIHAPIGLRNIVREWTPWRGRSLDVVLALVALLLLLLGFRAAIAVYLPIAVGIR